MRQFGKVDIPQEAFIAALRWTGLIEAAALYRPRRGADSPARSATGMDRGRLRWNRTGESPSRAIPKWSVASAASDEAGGRILRVACAETETEIRVINRDVRPERQSQTMTDITYDPDADAAYVTLSSAAVKDSAEVSPASYSTTTTKGAWWIELLNARKRLSPGAWSRAADLRQGRAHAAE